MSINKFVFSKGHAAIGLFCTMKVFDFISQEELETFCSDGSNFFGHVSHFSHPLIQLSTGSLGHGLPFAVGLAQAKKIKGEAGRVFVVVSDGEMNEGTTWESALLANKLKLNNLLCIIDRNHLQSLKSTEDTLPLEPLVDKWNSFGWDAINVDGHDFNSLSAIDELSARPRLIIANTSKGKGVSWMQDKILWHYKHPDRVELELALEEIEGDGK